MEVVAMVLQRPPVSTLSARQLRAGLRLSRERMARLLDVSAKTVERWEERDALPASGQVRSRLAQLREIADLGLAVYTPDTYVTCFSRPCPLHTADARRVGRSGSSYRS